DLRLSPPELVPEEPPRPAPKCSAHCCLTKRCDLQTTRSVAELPDDCREWPGLRIGSWFARPVRKSISSLSPFDRVLEATKKTPIHEIRLPSDSHAAIQ